MRVTFILLRVTFAAARATFMMSEMYAQTMRAALTIEQLEVRDNPQLEGLRTLRLEVLRVPDRELERSREISESAREGGFNL